MRLSHLIAYRMFVLFNNNLSCLAINFNNIETGSAVDCAVASCNKRARGSIDIGNALAFSPWLALPTQVVFGAALYLGTNRCLGSTVQNEALAYILPRCKASKQGSSEDK